MRERMHDKRGMSALAWILLGISAMFILFVPVDVALQAVQSHEFNSVLDNAVSSAITNIDEELVKTGEVKIDHENATRAVYDAVASAYNLEYAGNGLHYHFVPSSLEKSKLDKLPHIEVKIVDLTRDEIKNGVVKTTSPFAVYDSENQNKNDRYEYPGIETDTIVVRMVGEFPSQILSKRKGFTFDRISAAQVELSDVPKK